MQWLLLLDDTVHCSALRGSILDMRRRGDAIFIISIGMASSSWSIWCWWKVGRYGEYERFLTLAPLQLRTRKSFSMVIVPLYWLKCSLGGSGKFGPLDCWVRMLPYDAAGKVEILGVWKLCCLTMQHADLRFSFCSCKLTGALLGMEGVLLLEWTAWGVRNYFDIHHFLLEEWFIWTISLGNFPFGHGMLQNDHIHWYGTCNGSWRFDLHGWGRILTCSWIN